MRFRAVTGLFLSDARPMGSHFPLQDPVDHPAKPQGSFCAPRYAFSASLRVGPQLPVAAGLTRLDKTDRRVPLIDVEPNKRCSSAAIVQSSPARDGWSERRIAWGYPRSEASRNTLVLGCDGRKAQLGDPGSNANGESLPSLSA